MEKVISLALLCIFVIVGSVYNNQQIGSAQKSNAEYEKLTIISNPQVANRNTLVNTTVATCAILATLGGPGPPPPCNPNY